MSVENSEVDDKSKETPAPKGSEVNDRLLAESKANKKRAQELAAELDAIKNKQLEEQGNYKDLLEKEKKEKEELRNNLVSSSQKTLKANIQATVAKFATDVVDLEDLMNQPKFKKILEEGIDGEELTLSEDAAEKYVKAVLEAKPHLRKTVVIPGTHKGGKPNYNPSGPNSSGKSLSSMTQEELRAELAKVSKK